MHLHCPEKSGCRNRKQAWCRRGCTCIVRKRVAAGAASKLCSGGVAPALSGKELMQEQETSYVPAGLHLHCSEKCGCRSNKQVVSPRGCTCIARKGVAAGAGSKLCAGGAAPANAGKEWLQEQLSRRTTCRGVLLDETGKNSYTVIVC